VIIINVTAEQDTDAFASALYEAILTRGLTLDRLVHRLSDRGFALSTATLSYWSRGKSQPERPESLAALTELEDILEVPGGSLRGLLVERIRKGRSRPGQLVPFRDLWGELGAEVDQVINQVGVPPEQRRLLSFHERHRLDAQGTDCESRVITAIEALTDHVDRTLAIYRDDTGGAALPKIQPVSGTRLGRVRQDDVTHLLVAELLFDDVLMKGERTAFEYEMRFSQGGKQETRVERRFPSTIGQYVLEVVFDPAAKPARIWTAAESADGVETQRRALTINSAHTARSIWVAQPAGSYRIEWEWD
jgi:hypothetical protein